jgi:hypothetical protein
VNFSGYQANAAKSRYGGNTSAAESEKLFHVR